jgi:hypothetical protein
MATAAAIPAIPSGSIRSFGDFGPKYQVGKPLRPLGEDDWMIEITLIESGERTEYRLSRLLQDPEGK